MRLFVILNPVAGRSSPQEVRRLLAHYFSGPDWDLHVYETSGQESVGDVVRQALADGAERVIASGGDGTVSAVVDGLIGTDISLGILPAGTSNVVAQELLIPLNLEKACELLAGKTDSRTLDALLVDGQYYILGVGTGMDSLAIQNTGREEKNRFGPLAYVWSAIKVWVGVQPRRFTVIIDGERKRVRAADVLISNVGTLTRPLRWGRHIRPDDGQVDVLIIRARNLFDVFLVAWDVLVPGRPRRERNVTYLVAREAVYVSVEPPLPIQGDGELLGQTPLQAEVIPRAVKILVPQKTEKKAQPLKWLSQNMRSL